jgi:hypothetical protein
LAQCLELIFSRIRHDSESHGTVNTIFLRLIFANSSWQNRSSTDTFIA